MPDIGLLESLARLVLAAALGGAVGIERELREQEAGLRTHMLVALGASLFTLVSAFAWTDWRFSVENGLTLDPTRIAAQIVTGIGFLGAGAIIVRGISIKGLTTAASIWVVAAIGMACGAGFYGPAVGATALVLVSLYPLRVWSKRVLGEGREGKGTLHVEVANEARGRVVEEVERVSGPPLHVALSDRAVRIDLHAGRDVARLVAAIGGLDDVERVEWTP